MEKQLKSLSGGRSYRPALVVVAECDRCRMGHVHGVGYAYMDGQAHWVTGEHVVRGFLQSINWAETIVVAHNVKFDGAILAWHYGVKPKGYICTQAMARAAESSCRRA